MTPIDRRCDEQLQRRVRATLDAAAGRFPSLEDVAQQMCVSARTLKRRLRKRGLSYRRLLADTRLSRGAELLAQPGLSLEVVAGRLGYSSGANFSRAFRRWAGVSPGRYRKQSAPAQGRNAPAALWTSHCPE
ncbi:MAG: helix-turn-helix domain-containing protein [Solimonas sp.]